MTTKRTLTACERYGTIQEPMTLRFPMSHANALDLLLLTGRVVQIQSVSRNKQGWVELTLAPITDLDIINYGIPYDPSIDPAKLPGS